MPSLIDLLGRGKYTDAADLRLCGIGGAAVSPDLVRRMREALACPVMNRYTSTEAGITTGPDSCCITSIPTMLPSAARTGDSIAPPWPIRRSSEATLAACLA